MPADTINMAHETLNRLSRFIQAYDQACQDEEEQQHQEVNEARAGLPPGQGIRFQPGSRAQSRDLLQQEANGASQREHMKINRVVFAHEDGSEVRVECITNLWEKTHAACIEYRHPNDEEWLLLPSSEQEGSEAPLVRYTLMVVEDIP